MQGLRFLAGMFGALLFGAAGTDMQQLRSIGGDSVAEYFYQAMGVFSWGMAALSVAVGIAPWPTESAGKAAMVVLPTVAVPPGGMDSWSKPEATGTTRSLPEGLQLAVMGRSGDWAQVRSPNGFIGWVDNRRLVQL